MKFKDIQDALGTLARLSAELEEQYIENEGEVTPEAEALEEQKAAVADLLKGEGIDSLGRWLKAKEDEIKMWKAEKDAAARKVKSVQNTIDFIKAIIGDVMDVTGEEKVKGNYYSFSRYVSEKTTVDTELLDDHYLDLATEAARNAGLPDFLDVALVTTATRIREFANAHEGAGLGFLDVATADAVRFTKPRAGKDA